MILALLAVFCVAHAEPPRGAVAAGWSGGPSRFYGFVQAEPALGRSEEASVGFRATSSFLRYEIIDAYQKTTRVDSPGLALAAAFTYAPTTWSFDFTVGAEARRTLREQVDAARLTNLEIGVTLAIDASWRPDPRVAFSAGGNFSGANKYFFGRAGAQRQVLPLFRHDPPNALWLGVDATAQGNRDVRSVEGGALATMVIVNWKTSFSVRGDFGVEDLGHSTQPTARLGFGLYRWF